MRWVAILMSGLLLMGCGPARQVLNTGNEAEGAERRPPEVQKALDRRVTCDFIDTPIEDVVMFIGKATGIKIEFRPALNILNARSMREGRGKLRVSFSGNYPRAENALFWSAYSAGLVCRIEKDKYIMGTKEALQPCESAILDPDPDQERLRTAYEQWLKGPQRGHFMVPQIEKKISFDFREEPLADVLAFLNRVTGSSFVVDRELDRKAFSQKKVILRADNMRMASALEHILKPLGLQWKSVREAIFISRRNDRSDKIRRNLQKTVSFDFLETPLEQAVVFLSKVASMSIEFHPKYSQQVKSLSGEASEIPRSSLKVDRMTMANALFWITFNAGLSYEVREDRIVIGLKEDLRNAESLYISGEPTKPEDVLAKWAYHYSPPVTERKVTFDFRNKKIEGALDVLAKAVGTVFIVDPELTGDPTERKELEGISLKVENCRMLDALRMITKPRGLKVEIVRQAFYISHTDRTEP